MTNEELAAEISALKSKLAALEKVQAQGAAGIPPLRRPLGPSIDYTAGMSMPPNTQRDMARVVPDIDRGSFDAAAHARTKPAQPGGFGPPKEPPQHVDEPKRGSGWVEPRKPDDRTKQFERFDAMVAAMVGGPNDTRKLK
jgi:hypothetical protein